MTARTSWASGNGVGLTWSAAFNSSDLTSLPNGDTVLSSVADIANQTNLDMFMDVSIRLAIASSTIAAGAALALWIYELLDDGTTYGDGQLVAATQAAKTPAFPPCASIYLPPASAVTKLVGSANQIIIPPGAFRLALQNLSGFALSSGTQDAQYRTYNINLND